MARPSQTNPEDAGGRRGGTFYDDSELFARYQQHREWSLSPNVVMEGPAALELRPAAGSSQLSSSPTFHRIAHRMWATRDDSSNGSPETTSATSRGKSSGPPGVGSAQTSSSRKSEATSWIRQSRALMPKPYAHSSLHACLYVINEIGIQAPAACGHWWGCCATCFAPAVTAFPV
jgi:hypothetical protein